MASYLHLAQTARVANARLRAARDLESRWKALPPEQQTEAREEWSNVKVALSAVRTRMEAGPRGFVREFKAGLAGTESEPVAEPRPLAELAGELHTATRTLRDKLNAIES
jgi:hypothetical protein